ENPEDFIWISEDDIFNEEKRRLKTIDVKEIYLSKGVREIGRYAFYRCCNLRKLSFSDEIREIGGGALNGCRGLREVDIHLMHGERSALKSIVDEVRFEIHANLYYYRKDSVEKAELIFPEHYEEAVENTPARILYTSHHGAGGYYRQCFLNREVDYKKYDELLPWAIAEDSTENVLRLALLRLRFPYKLSEKVKKAYEEYVREHQKEAAKYWVEKEDMDNIHFCLQHKYWDAEALAEGIDTASMMRKTDILSLLMNEKQKVFPKKKKTFEL
ncbi:MAG: leucine-rich repeat protein, partial [Dorea sp.]